MLGREVCSEDWQWKGHCWNCNRGNQGCTTEGMKETLETGEGGEGKLGMVTPCSPDFEHCLFCSVASTTQSHIWIFWRPKLSEI